MKEVTVTPDQKEFLDELRDSGVTNMFGAASYLVQKFGLTRQEARDVLQTWMLGCMP